MPERNVEAVRRCFDGWNRKDFDALVADAHPDIEWFSEIAARMEGSEAVYRGREGMRRYWDEWQALWDVTIELREVIDLGEKVLVIARVRAHGDASGIDVESPIAYVFEFENGLARRVRSYFEAQRAFEAVGLPADTRLLD